MGPRRERRRLRAHRGRRGLRDRARDGRRPSDGGAAPPGAEARRRAPHRAARRRRLRPLARPRLGRARARPAAGPRGPRSCPPPRARGRPDLVLCLALVHPLAIARNVPLADVVAWLHALGGELVVEFPGREDPMVQRLLAPKNDDAHTDYELDAFERALGEAFEIRRREALPSGARVLFEATPR